jgi:hypothetical protein
LLETSFFLPDKDILSIDIFYFYLKLNPAIRYIFYFLKKKIKGCRYYQG